MRGVLYSFTGKGRWGLFPAEGRDLRGRLFAAFLYLLPSALDKVVLFCKPGAAYGRNRGKTEIGREIVFVYATRGHEADPKMGVRRGEGLDHSETAERFGRKKLQQGAAQRQRGFDVTRGGNTGSKGQAGFEGIFGHLRVESGSDSEPGAQDTSSHEVLRVRSIPVFIRPPYRAAVPWIDPRFLRSFYMRDFDLVHSHAPCALGMLAQTYGRKRHVPHISTFHSKYREDLHNYVKFNFLTDALIRRIIRFYNDCDVVWACEGTDDVLREYGYEGEITIAPNGTDLAIPTGAEYEADRKRGREFAGLREDDFVFLYLGQHRWEKNIKLIVDGYGALKRRLAANPNTASKTFRAVFVGDGCDAENIKKRAQEQGVAKETLFLGRIEDRNVIKSIYAASDIFVFPSYYDNAPLTLREAAAYAVPAVLGRGSTTAKVVRDGENGFLTENDAGFLSQLLEQLMQNPAAYKQAGEGARRTIYRSWEDIVAWAVGQYKDIIAAYGTPARP